MLHCVVVSSDAHYTCSIPFSSVIFSATSPNSTSTNSPETIPGNGTSVSSPHNPENDGDGFQSDLSCFSKSSQAVFNSFNPLHRSDIIVYLYFSRHSCNPHSCCGEHQPDQKKRSEQSNCEHTFILNNLPCNSF